MSTPAKKNEDTPALKRALFALKDLRARLDKAESAKTEPIAIIGIGCRFPGGANDPEAYWKILNEGIDVITEVPAERWDIEKYYDPDPNAPGKMYVRKAGFINHVDKFEPQFFGISPREVSSMDPQQRILLELTWEALEHAGIVPGDLAGSQTGVFVGMSTNDYSNLQIKKGDIADFDAYIGTGTSFSVAAGRISYILGLHGPTLTIDTACSSALVAIHLACQSLRMGQANVALAGSVSLMLAPEATVSMSKAHALAPDGYSKTFDAAADGYGRGEGCGMIVLKRLSDALVAEDNILAVIRGSAINHDGRSSGLTVPNGLSQQAVIRAALEDTGGIEPQQIQFVETHGTGTQLGDPIEVRALAATLGKDRPKDKPLILGSVKANIGHLEAASGVAGIIKVVLAFQHERIPKQIHFKDPNRNIEWDLLPVRVANEMDVWPRTDTPRVAGVSAFGLSGTNAHIILEEPPSFGADADVERAGYLLTLSANHENALSELAARFVKYFEQHPELSLERATYTANSRRTLFTHRLAVVGNSKEQFLERLKRSSETAVANGILKGQTVSSASKIAFLFTGQGSQYIDMGRQLYETNQAFRLALERCDELLRPYLEKSLLTVLYPKVGEESPIHETAYTQPALFALEYALAELWRSWGKTPSIVMGHSVGEYVGACVAGVFSLEDGLKLIAERGRLMQALPRGGVMAAVFTNQARVAKAIAPYSKDVSIAAINGLENIVISGRDASMQAVLDDLAKDGIKASRLSVSHAFHSPLMDPILDAFEQTAASLTYSKPKISIVSNVTGELIPGEQIGQPSYWRTHLRQPVQFQKAMETLHDQGYKVFLEIGPQPILLGMGQRCISGEKNIWLASLRQRKEDWLQMLESLGTLYVNGMEVDWEGFHQ
ncbi:MAG: type I polyketide synthase, partial [Anaerolineales bacterium]